MNKEENNKNIKKDIENINDENSETVEDIEVVIGDDSILNISEVGDMMNNLRPKDSEKNKKNVIIPVAKKKTTEQDENTSTESNDNNDNSNNNDNNDNNEENENK